MAELKFLRVENADGVIQLTRTRITSKSKVIHPRLTDHLNRLLQNPLPFLTTLLLGVDLSSRRCKQQVYNHSKQTTTGLRLTNKLFLTG